MNDLAGNFAGRAGGYLCGAVRFHAVSRSLNVNICQCLMRRRWSGGVFASAEVFSDWNEMGVEVPTVCKSSKWAQRRFCYQCGTTISSQLNDGSNTMLAAPAFDNDDDFVLSTEIFIDKKPDFYEFSNGSKQFTEADVLAHFSEKRS